MRSAPVPQEQLAIHGGRPVRLTILPYGRQSIDEEDIRAVVDVLRSDWLTTGPKIAEFEEAFATRVGARYAVSFSSGTAALHGAVFAAGLQAGDEGITTPMTFCATANCLVYQGAKPVFADVSPDTLNLDPDLVPPRLSPRTRAIIPVDYAGHPADLQPFMEMSERHGLIVIEDACHALGANYASRPVGSIAHLTVFSLHPVKHITTGEGGIVTTNDVKLANRLRMFRNHGIDSDARQRQAGGRWFYSMVELGYNYRLTDIASALGLTQLRKLEPNLKRRREIAVRYRSEFSGLRGLEVPQVRSSCEPAWHLYPVRLKSDTLRAGRNEIFNALRAENIGVNVHYIPVHLHPFYAKRFACRAGDCPVAEAAYERLISLPMFHAMTGQDVDDVIHAVGKVLAYYAA
jgi:perosamine synthetase